MTKYEERAFQVGKAKPELAGLKNQLRSLKEDLSRFMARKPDGGVIAPLRQRIRELEVEIGEMEQRRTAERQAARPDEGGQPSGPAGTHSGPGHFPPRRRG